MCTGSWWGNLREKRPLERPRRRWEDNINKMVFISQTHLFIIVLNVLFGQHVSTLY